MAEDNTTNIDALRQAIKELEYTEHKLWHERNVAMGRLQEARAMLAMLLAQDAGVAVGQTRELTSGTPIILKSIVWEDGQAMVYLESPRNWVTGRLPLEEVAKLKLSE